MPGKPGQILLVSAYMFVHSTLLAQDLSEHTHLSLLTVALPPLSSTATEPGFLEQIAKELFGRLHIDAEVAVLPGERALINANNGIDDGDLMRAPGFEKMFPNLVQVSEPVGVMDFMVYTTRQDIKIRNWSDLQPYSVGYVSGWKIFDRNVKSRDITHVREIDALFPLLVKHRVDVILIDRWQGLWEARKHGGSIHMLEPPLASSNMFIYMNKKHAALVPEIARTLAEMKRDGSYERIFNQTLKPFERH